MRENITQEDDLHILTSIHDSGITGTKSIENRIKPKETNNHDQCAQKNIENNNVRQHIIG